MDIYEYIEDRSAVVFARAHGLQLSYDDDYALELKELTKRRRSGVRHVRTPAGVARFKQPIGSIIVKNKKLNHVKILRSKFKGWSLVELSNGMKFDVTKERSGRWSAYPHMKHDSPTVSESTEERLYEKLDAVGEELSKLFAFSSPPEPPVKKTVRNASPVTTRSKKRKGWDALKEPEPFDFSIAPVPDMNDNGSNLKSVREASNRFKEHLEELRGSIDKATKLSDLIDVEQATKFADGVYRYMEKYSPEGGMADATLAMALYRNLATRLAKTSEWGPGADPKEFDFPELNIRDRKGFDARNKLLDRLERHYETYIYTGSLINRDSDDHKTPLSTAELDAITNYTSSAYEPLNEYLRTGVSNDPSYSYKDLDAMTANIESALDKFQAPEDVYASRHVPSDLFKNVKVGDTVTDKGFMSTSVKTEWSFKEQLTRYLRGSSNGLGRGNVSSLHLKIPKGTHGAYIARISRVPHEEEFLLPPGTSVKVVGIRDTPFGKVFEAIVINDQEEQ